MDRDAWQGVFNGALLERADPAGFRNAKPFPWWNPEGFLERETFEGLVRTAPPLELFEASFGLKRSYGQQSHDRYTLKYRDGLPLSPEWSAFVGALSGPEYRSFIARMFGTKRFRLDFYWQCTPRGCSVSPHCDARRKLGSHLFYLTTPSNWKREWGGETVLLDDGGRFSYQSAPALQEFGDVITTETVGNRSLLFMRTNHSWHAVRELTQPEGILRMLFTVVIRREPSPAARLGSGLLRLASSVRRRSRSLVPGPIRRRGWLA